MKGDDRCQWARHPDSGTERTDRSYYSARSFRPDDLVFTFSPEIFHNFSYAFNIRGVIINTSNSDLTFEADSWRGNLHGDQVW